MYIIYTAAYSINLFLGLPTNLYGLWLIVTGAGGLVASDFFTLNLAVSEILFCLNCLLNIFYMYFQINGSVLKVIGFCTGFISTGRPLFQCSVCVERYLAVVHPVTFLKYKPLRYRVGCSGLVWLMVLGSCFVHVLNEFQLAINYFILGLNLVVFSVMLFCCLAVLRALKRPGPGEGDREREGINMKMRAFRIIVIIMVAMLMSYFTIIVAIPLQNFLEDNKLGLSFSICFSIVVVFGFVQPLLYLHRVGKLACFRGP